MAIFGPKRWVNPFGKMSIFRLFELLVFIAQKGVFSFQNIVKDIFLAYISLEKRKKIGKMAIFGPKRWVNPFGKMSVFQLFEFLVFIGQNGVFLVLEYRKRHFSSVQCLKKMSEIWPFLDQDHGLTPLEKCQFFDLLNILFLQTRKAFFWFQNIVKDIFPAYIA